MKDTSKRGWHVRDWGMWGWIETGLKEVAIAAGVVAFLATAGQPFLPFSTHPKPLLVLLLGAMTLGMVVQLGFRVWQREIISVVFAVTMFIGHAALLASVMRAPDFRIYGVVFSVFQVLGDMAKRHFLTITGYSENDFDTATMKRGILGIIAAYVVLCVLFLA